LLEARLERIETSGHFGDVKHLGDGLCELRWKSGLRIYFCKHEENAILLLLGGIKNAQTKDIKQARLLLG
jgi:putative addiction module killer protein